MLNSHKVRQPNCFEAFRCLGSECDDTCCDGWAVSVDRLTWEKYHNPALSERAGIALLDVVELNPARSSDSDHARIRLEGTRCPAMVCGLCSIQQKLGEPDIPDLCSAYPRVVNVIGDVLEKSLHTSCPEAARLILNDPSSMVVSAIEDGVQTYRPGALTFTEGTSGTHLTRARGLFADVIRERSLPLWQRIVSLGMVIDRIADLDTAETIPILEDHLNSLRQPWFPEIFTAVQHDPPFQIELVLELIVGRIADDYVAPRFLECYGEFMAGMEWTSSSTIDEIAARYQAATREYYIPFVEQNPHLLENFILNYLFRTVFPYRRKTSAQKLVLDFSRASMTSAFTALVVHYAIIRTILIGMAAVRRHDLNPDHVVKLVQSYSKAFLHSAAFETKAIHSVGQKGESPVRLAALLLRE